jgi:hypothetical protein
MQTRCAITFEYYEHINDYRDAFSDALRSVGIDVEKCVEFKPLVAWQQH